MKRGARQSQRIADCAQSELGVKCVLHESEACTLPPKSSIVRPQPRPAGAASVLALLLPLHLGWSWAFPLFSSMVAVPEVFAD